MEIAAIWKRALALLVDSFAVTLLSLVVILVSIYLYDYTGGRSDYSVGLMIFFEIFFCSWIYNAAFESSKYQATLGKRIFGLKVEDEFGTAISFGKASARFILKQVSMIFLYIGCLIAFFTKKKQAFHDLICSTYVVSSN